MIGYFNCINCFKLKLSNVINQYMIGLYLKTDLINWNINCQKEDDQRKRQRMGIDDVDDDDDDDANNIEIYC